VQTPTKLTKRQRELLQKLQGITQVENKPQRPYITREDEGYVWAGMTRLLSQRLLTEGPLRRTAKAVKQSRPSLKIDPNTMTRRRWIADEVSGNRAAILGDHARHLAQVLRAQIGWQFDISTGSEVRSGTVAAIHPDRVEFELGESIQQATKRK